MAYATTKEIDLASKLGYLHEKSYKNGSSFRKLDRRVWSLRDGWQTADLENGWYKNHRKFKDLSDALRRDI